MDGLVSELLLATVRVQIANFELMTPNQTKQPQVRKRYLLMCSVCRAGSDEDIQFVRSFYDDCMLQRAASTLQF